MAGRVATLLTCVSLAMGYAPGATTATVPPDVRRHDHCPAGWVEVLANDPAESNGARPTCMHLAISDGRTSSYASMLGTPPYQLRSRRFSD
jgi:hypothetical protein